MSIHSCPYCWETNCECGFFRFSKNFENQEDAFRAWDKESLITRLYKWVFRVDEKKREIIALAAAKAAQREQFFLNWVQNRKKLNE